MKHVKETKPKTISYKLTKGIHKIKCKNGHDNKTCEACSTEYKDCECYLENESLIDDLIVCKCMCCKKNYWKKFDEELKNQFGNTWKFCNHDMQNLFWFAKKKCLSIQMHGW